MGTNPLDVHDPVLITDTYHEPVVNRRNFSKSPEAKLADITVSVAEFKARLSQILAESRSFGWTIVITSRMKPIATVVPCTGGQVPGQPGPGGMVSLAGRWTETQEIRDTIDSIYRSRQAELRHPIITIGVASIEDAAKRIEAAGGAMGVPRTEVPDMGYAAYFRDPEGNIMGLWQDL
jgi:prevent-host-death family protein